MSHLRIADLAESKTLDRSAMTAVRGGMRTYPSYAWGNFGDQFVAVNPVQAIEQFQGINNAVGNNVANFGFADIHNTNRQTQNAQNNVNVGGLL